MSPMKPQPDADTDRAHLDSIAASCSWASPNTPAVVPPYIYAAIKRLADDGNEEAQERPPRARVAGSGSVVRVEPDRAVMGGWLFLECSWRPAPMAFEAVISASAPIDRFRSSARTGMVNEASRKAHAMSGGARGPYHGRAITYALAALLAAAMPAATWADDLPNFWDLKPEHLRVLVASPQVMVAKTSSGRDAYCRCPVILRPHEIPEIMKKAIVAVEDKRYANETAEYRQKPERRKELPAVADKPKSEPPQRKVPAGPHATRCHLRAPPSVFGRCRPSGCRTCRHPGRPFQSTSWRTASAARQGGGRFPWVRTAANVPKTAVFENRETISPSLWAGGERRA